MNILENKNKNYIYNKLYINSIKYIYNQIKLHNTNIKYNDCQYILYKTANERYNIESILNKLFPYLRLDFNLEKFGRSRSKFDIHGRKYIAKTYDKKKYIPFNFLLDDNYEEPILTPINVKYKHYNDKIKNICNNDYNIHNIYKIEPLLKLLYNSNPSCYNITYKNIQLTSFYYENNDDLYNELKTIPMHDRLLTTDMNMYRAIYHTDPIYHPQILTIINKKYKKIINNVNNINYNDNLYNKNLRLIKKIYWWLSHATLYERGSCAISEIFCNALLLYINNKKNSKFIYFDNRVFNNILYNTDIEAMLISDPNIFVNNFDLYTKYNELPNDNYVKLNINNILYGNNNNNYKRLYDYINIENINILEYLSNYSPTKSESVNIHVNNLINEFN
jgi:hypothetical protein